MKGLVVRFEDENVLKAVRVVAALRGQSMNAWVVEAIRAQLNREDQLDGALKGLGEGLITW